MKFDYSRIDNIYGSLITKPKPQDKREVKYSYDRMSFYPNLLLDIEAFPTRADVEEKYHTGKEIKVITFSVKAARRKGKNGIFINTCAEVVSESKLTMFEEEFNRIFKKEFIIWEYELLSVERIPLVKQTEKFHEHFRNRLDKKEKARFTGDYVEIKTALNRDIGMLASLKDGEDDGNMDRLSLAYLQCKARQEMYYLIRRYEDKVINFFVDTVKLAEDIEELHNEDVWRKELG